MFRQGPVEETDVEGVTVQRIVLSTGASQKLSSSDDLGQSAASGTSSGTSNDPQPLTLSPQRLIDPSRCFKTCLSVSEHEILTYAART